jgi:hypothetical protein
VQQVPGVRGSPLIRFVFLALALVATGAGLARITGHRAPAAVPLILNNPPPRTSLEVPFQLLLSDPAAEVKIVAEGPVMAFTGDVSPLAGKLMLDPENPQLSLVVHWKNASKDGEHRFAKLTLEAPGQATFTHVFDANGDIDDFIELPLP